MANINGRATSMEFMFGVDVLRDGTGELIPVRWHGFNEKLGEYQGHLDAKGKSQVGARIDAALSAATSGPIADQVLLGCERLAMLLLAAAEPPRQVPASESSILTAVWRKDPFCDIRIQGG